MCPYRYQPLNVSAMRTRSIQERESKVAIGSFGKVYQKDSGIRGLLDSFPRILAGTDFHRVIDAVKKARALNRGIIWGLGGHVVKCGLNLILIDLLKRGFVTAFAINGAVAIHDFEVAILGSTSEDVEKELVSGDFGSARETAEWMNEAIQEGYRQGVGIGESLGAFILRNLHEFPFHSYSLLASAYATQVPVTVHVAVGTDIIHNHPSSDGASLGQGSLHDFRLLTSIVRDLHEGGIYLNCGSAVILPEVFLKVVSMVRNLGYPLEGFTTVNLDFLQHYRQIQNVVRRPTLGSGIGISLTGHHELMIPLLAACLIDTC